MDNATAFMSLFRGRPDVWGSVEGRSNKEAVGEAHYQQHLEGKRSLGIYPLLDDGNCYFAAVDIDEKDFSKALLVRNALFKMNVQAYIAQSKGKGFHVYIFAETKFLARDIRSLLRRTLEQVDYSAEIFPKQDKLDNLTKYGNYINLPYFGMNSRMFMTARQVALPFEAAFPKIVRVSEAALGEAIKGLPPEAPPLLPSKAPKVKGGKKVHPPCILTIMKGVSQGQRDEAAFALARHHLDQMYLPEEVLALIVEWDKRNRPPVNDLRLLQTKVQSAEKGYRFGCSSITDEPLLATFCKGADKCEWLIEGIKDKKKRGEIKEVSSLDTETHLYEEIVVDKKPMFVAFEKKTGGIQHLEKMEIDGVTYLPYYSSEITEEVIRLPTGVEDYGSLNNLVNNVNKHILKYLDLASEYLEFATWYVIMTWTYDKLPNVQYLRFLGDTGTGKSRALDVVGDICYKPMMLAGAVTPAPIYRIIDRFRGTLILDEADFRDSTEKSEVVTILNCGYERRRAVVRCSKDDPDNLQILPCFGPKLFATRYTFEDKALESRCLTIDMVETSRDDIPPYLGGKYLGELAKLRNQLLLYRFRTQPLVDAEAGDQIDLGNIEPRLKQTGIPYAIPFMNNPEIMDRYKGFMYERNQKLILERSESAQGRVLYAFFKCAISSGKSFVTASAIKKYCQEELSLDIKHASVGKLLRPLGIVAGKKRALGSRSRCYIWNDFTMRSQRKRYFPDDEEFEELFEAGLGPIVPLKGPEPEPEPSEQAAPGTNLDLSF